MREKKAETNLVACIGVRRRMRDAGEMASAGVGGDFGAVLRNRLNRSRAARAQTPRHTPLEFS